MLIGPRSDSVVDTDGLFGPTTSDLGLARAGDRAGVVAVTGVGGLPVEGAGRVELYESESGATPLVTVFGSGVTSATSVAQVLSE